MQITRVVSLTDLVVLIVVAVALFLPPRTVTASAVDKLAPEGRLALAYAEARATARPDDGAAVYDYSRRLGEAGQLDWAVQVAGAAADRAAGTPAKWRAELAASVAHADRLEVKEALEWANRALGSCALAGEEACPSWDQIRMELYQRHLDAGVKSGIDARKDPRAFREAGEAALRRVRALDTKDAPRPPAPPAPPAPAP